MKTRFTDKQGDLFTSLIGSPTPAKVSGLTFTLASIGLIVASFAFMMVLYLTGIAAQEGFEKTDGYLYISYLLTPLVFGLVAFALLRWTKTPLQAEWKAQLCKPKYYAMAVLLQVGLFSLSQLNTLFLQFLSQFGYQEQSILLPSMDGFGFVGVLLVVALLPAIFEELIFRGLLLKGLHVFGEVGAVLLCGGLFALYHQNPAQTLYQFCCGAAFAFVALRSGSILPTVLSHFINNAVILTLTKCGVSTFSPAVAWSVGIVSFLCLIAAMVWLFMDKQEKQEELDALTITAEKGRFWKSAGVGIALCTLIWCTQLLAGM
ncbi:MAG: CPBP family intramembrane metalloprotease [Clostridia bacterium]|nr:CPBP family intramembrane metalloprotease [Clostridia bacterium]